MLSEIARIEPHAACACFTTGLKHKLTFLMRTISGEGTMLPSPDSYQIWLAIVENTIEL